MKKVKVGIVGCGNISNVYITNMQNLFKNLEAYAVCDIVVENAKTVAEKFGIEKVYTLEEMLADKDVELILNITTPQSHYKINKAALLAGKNIYVEKPLAITYAEAKELKEIAIEKNLMIGCAPDTFMGSGYQTARALVDLGIIGTPSSAFTFDVCHGHENWHPNPKFFYEYGAGPLYDRGPYNLTVLINLLGAIESVYAVATKAYEKRTKLCGPDKGDEFDIEIPTHISSILTFKSGVVCTMTHSFDIYGSKLPKCEIHGTLGSLSLPDPNTFRGPIYFTPANTKEFREVPLLFKYEENCRGLGLSDMANCIIGKKTTMRPNVDMACHVVEIMEALHKSSELGEKITLESTCEKPEVMDASLTFGEV